MQITQRLALITGASDGIGAACAGELRRRGARLVLTGRSQAKLELVAQSGDTVLAGDLMDAAFRCRLIAESGAVDLLVNCAGVGLYAPASRTEMGPLREMFELNLFAAVDLTQRVLPGMRGRGRGVVVNVSSIAGQITLPWMTFYSASKFALNSFTEGLRSELRGTGVHVMAVCPGYVKTEFQAHVLAGDPPESIRNAKRFGVSAEQCARAMADGVEREARTVVTPGSARLLVGLARLAPGVVESQLAAMNRRLEAET
jgi:short-subunit dehydrogenase